MVVDEGEEREIERGEEEGPGPTPDRKGDDVDESLEGEHGKEPEEGFHVEGEKTRGGKTAQTAELSPPPREAPGPLQLQGPFVRRVGWPGSNSGIRLSCFAVPHNIPAARRARRTDGFMGEGSWAGSNLVMRDE